MKYIKYFKTHAEYIKYITDNKKILPNLSSCEDNDDIHISQDERRIFASINNNVNKTLTLYIDDFRQVICDRDYNSDMLAFKQDCVQNFDTKDGINVYIYTGETFTYNNTEYYLWESTDFMQLNTRYILTDRLNFEGLSLEDNIDNDYCPYICKLTQDFEEYDSVVNDFLLVVRAKNQYQQYLDLYLYFDDFPQEIADDEYDGDMDAFKQDYMFDNIQEGNEYVYMNTMFTYDNTNYYLWKKTLNGSYSYGIAYLLTDRLNFKGLSLEDDIDNDYCPFVYILNEDMTRIYDNQDKYNYLLTGIRGISKDVFNDDVDINANANLMIYIDEFEQDFADDEFNGNIAAAKQYFMEHLNLCDMYLYTNNTFTYNNIEYYLWELQFNTDSGALPYLLTNTLDFTGLSLTDNINNNYNPVCYLLSSDKDVVYGANDIDPKTLLAIAITISPSDNINMLYNKIVNDISGFQKIEIDGEEISLSELQENKGIYAFSKDKSYVITYTLKNSFIIESEALANTNIDDVIIPDNVRFIENEAFYNCNNLTNVTLGSSVEEICNAAFKNCVNLKTVIINASTVPEFCNYEDEFANNANDRIIYVPLKSFLDYQDAWPQYICQYNLMPNTEPLIIIFTVYSDDNYIQLFNLESTDNIEDYFEKIIIDDVGRPLSYYDNQPYYISVGKHTVKYVLKDRTTIPEELFSDNENITDIIIPEGIQCIYAYAFSNTNIHTLVIPSTVNYINNTAFINCNNLEYIEVDNHNNTYDSRNNCNAIIQTSNNTLILGCKNTVIPNTVTTLDTYAFTGSRIQSIEIPANVSTIGDRTFQNCTKLTNITCLSATAPIVNYNTFQGVATGGVLNLPNGTTGYYSWISKLNYYNWSVNSPYNYELICTYNITSTNVKTILCKKIGVIVSMEIDGVTLQDKVTSYKFNTTGEHIVKFNIIDTVNSQMFQGCSNLTNIEFSEGIDDIQFEVFENCTNLTSITLPNSITTLSYGVFKGCTSLTNISIGTGITIIWSYTFFNCSSLSTLVIPANIIDIGKPYNSNMYENPFEACSGLTSIIVDSSNLVYDSRNNCNAIIKTATNTLVTGCQNTIIPNSVTTIGFRAFSGCTGLTSITIPNGVTSIGIHAFQNCSGLETITCLGSTAPTITTSTFQNVKTCGTLYVPQGSTGYDLWMSTTNYYLGKYNWTIVYQ